MSEEYRKISLGRCLLDGVPTEFFERRYHHHDSDLVEVEVYQPERRALVVVDDGLDIDGVCDLMLEGKGRVQWVTEDYFWPVLLTRRSLDGETRARAAYTYEWHLDQALLLPGTKVHIARYDDHGSVVSIETIEV